MQDGLHTRVAREACRWEKRDLVAHDCFCVLFLSAYCRSATLHESSNIASISLSEDGRFGLVNVIRPAELHLWDLGSLDSDSPAPAISLDEHDAAGMDVHEDRPAASTAAAAAAAAPHASFPGVRIPAASRVGVDAAPHLSALAAPSLLRRFTGYHANRFIVRSCLGGPSSSLVLSGSEDGLVHVWARESGALLAKLRGHTATVNAVAATRFRGQHLLASAADDHTVHLWAVSAQAGHDNHAHSQPHQHQHANKQHATQHAHAH